MSESSGQDEFELIGDILIEEANKSDWGEAEEAKKQERGSLVEKETKKTL